MPNKDQFDCCFEKELRDSCKTVQLDSDLNQETKIFSTVEKKNTLKLLKSGRKSRNLYLLASLEFPQLGNKWLEDRGVRTVLKVLFACRAHCFTIVICYWSIHWTRSIKIHFSVIEGCRENKNFYIKNYHQDCFWRADFIRDRCRSWWYEWGVKPISGTIII